PHFTPPVSNTAAQPSVNTGSRSWTRWLALRRNPSTGSSRFRATCFIQSPSGAMRTPAGGDSNLYLRRTGDSDQLALAIEHRAAASSVGLALHFLARGDGLALHVDDAPPAGAPPPSATPSAIDRVEAILAQADAPLSLKALRAAAKMRAATVSDALAALVTQGRARRSDTGYLPVPR